MVIIAAMDKNRLIGKDNGLPWKLSADLQNFKKLTTGNAIIMGRKTWDSLGRALPNRKNIVVSRDVNLQIPGVHVVNSLAEAKRVAGEMKTFVIGGSQIYQLALNEATEMILTEVDATVEGDAWFPEFDQSAWQKVSTEEYGADEKNEFNFKVVHYIRK